MKQLTLTFILLPAFFASIAQEFSITKVEFKNQKVLLHYSIVDTILTRTYTVSIFSSNDNFTIPLQKVSGDVGLEVRPGGNKLIVWDAPGEFGNSFSGKVGLEIRGRVYIPFIRVENFKKGDVSIKRGKPYQVTWTGGTRQNILNFELMRDDKRVYVFPNIANVGHNTFVFPISIKPYKKYHFKITDSKNKDEVVFTQTFSIKRKFPLLLKVVPVAVMVSAAAMLLSGKTVDDFIPDAPIVN